jgi:hypothetical protein
MMSQEEAIRLITQGEIVRLADAARPTTKTRLRLTGSICPKCGTSGALDVTLELVRLNEKNEEETSELAHLTYPGVALPVFEAIFRGPDEEKS